jgi:hypothetical protein
VFAREESANKVGLIEDTGLTRGDFFAVNFNSNFLGRRLDGNRPRVDEDATLKAEAVPIYVQKYPCGHEDAGETKSEKHEKS